MAAGSGVVPKAVLVALVLAVALVAAAAIAGGSIAPALVFAISAMLIVLAVARLAVPSEVRWLTSVVLVAFALRSIVAAVLVLRSLALGNGGFTTGDDIWYASAADHLVRYLQGDPEIPYVPPFWNGEYYLMTTYVYVESAVFWAFGQHVLNMILVNAMIGALTVLLVADTACRIFGRAAGIASGVVLAVYPSMLLWSAVNLRDAIIVFFIALTLWALTRLRASPSIAWIVAVFCIVWAEEGLRSYLEAVLLGTALATVFVVFGVMGRQRRLRWPITASVLFTLLLAHSGLTSFLTDPFLTLGNVVEVRISNQFGRTAFGTPPPEAAQLDTSSSPSVPTPPTARRAPPTPRTAGGAPLGLAEDGVPTTPRPQQQIPIPDAIASAFPGFFSTAPEEETRPGTNVFRGGAEPNTAVSRSLAHLPTGLIYTFFAPFPWAIRTMSELAAMPDMLLWYVVLGGAIMTVWSQRRRWDSLFAHALFLGTLLFLLALGEGNVGTLFRHRAMAVPAAILLASPTLVALGRRALSAEPTRRIARGPVARLVRLLAGPVPAPVADRG